MSEDEHDDCELENMFNVLLDSMQREVEEAFRYIWDNHGRTHICRAMSNQRVKGGTMLGVIFNPSDKKAPEAGVGVGTPEAQRTEPKRAYPPCEYHVGSAKGKITIYNIP
jgi:hypothetical protein